METEQQNHLPETHPELTLRAPLPAEIPEELIFDFSTFFSRLMDSFNKAQTSIDLETYIFDYDQLGKKIVASLQAAAQRGVRVRMLLDGFGSLQASRFIVNELIQSGIEVRIFHPLPWGGLNFFTETFASWRKLGRKLSGINERNHRKVCVIDEERAWMGGMNISLAHKDWRDTGVIVGGNSVASLLHAFESAWAKAWRPNYSRREHFQKKFRRRLRPQQLVRLNLNYQERRSRYFELLSKIDLAQKRIWITNAYFVPPQRFLRQLQETARRGVDVKIIVTKKCDIFFIPWVSKALYYELLRSGVRIFEYLTDPLHAKTMVIDDWATVGSSNLNHRSFFHDLEVDIVLTQDESLTALTRQFHIDLTHSRELTQSDWKKRPWYVRFFGKLLLHLRYWI